MQAGHLAALRDSPDASEARRGLGYPEGDCRAYEFAGDAETFFRTNWRQFQNYSHWLYCYTPDRGWLAAPAPRPQEAPDHRIIAQIRPLSEWIAQVIMENKAAMAN